MEADTLIVLDGSTFFYACANADVEAGDGQGLFFKDVRHLSRWVLRVDGEQLVPLTSRRVDYYSQRVVATKPGEEDAPALAVQRDRFVSDGVHEDVVVENLSSQPCTVELELGYAADFADVVEAQADGNGSGRHWQEPAARSVTLWCEREGRRRGTVLTFSRHGRVSKDRASFAVELAPRERWSLCVDLTPVAEGRRWPPLLRCGGFHAHAPKMPISLDEWLDRAPELESDDYALQRTYRPSLLDLAALRIRPDEVTIGWAMPAGGIPWFMAVFGRDSLIAAYQALPFQSELARATPEALAELQATEWDSFRDAEPGKILHELRCGLLAETGRVPHTPYYGSHDATLLWLIVLDEYERWTGDGAFLRTLEPSFRAALAWLEGPADLDGDGYLEYRKRSSSDQALDNHCWRDSNDAIRFADGRQAQPPIAAASVQGYAYDARLRAARLLRDVFGETEKANQLERDAASLKERFNDDFWSRSRRHYVLALDAEKRQVDALTSEIGQLALERNRRRAPCRRVGSGADAGGPVQRLGHPDDVRARRRLPSARLPPRDGLAARHRDRRGGAAPLRLPRRGGDDLPGPARGGGGLRQPASGAVRRLRPRRHRSPGRVRGRAQAPSLGGRRSAPRSPHPARPRRRPGQASLAAAPAAGDRSAAASERARPRPLRRHAERALALEEAGKLSAMPGELAELMRARSGETLDLH
ncbi:MAG TPA: glycogen debranching N-terminal domain-containing protein, partial [Gaiellaceae bacterium]|nr:glycogen debranching N-terminal domain-containing protein [Gaiellaceae bacterium]